MDVQGLYDIANGNLPEILMIAAGLIAILIVHFYRKDDDSASYKFMVLIGFFLGIALMFFGITRYSGWTKFDAALIIVAGFTLAMRPIRKVPFALLLGILAMALAYVYLGTLTGDLEFLSEGTPRIVITLVAGALVYMVFNFLEKLTDLVAAIFNMWPVLFVLGIVCIVEGLLMLADQPSLISYIEDFRADRRIFEHYL